VWFISFLSDSEDSFFSFALDPRDGLPSTRSSFSTRKSSPARRAFDLRETCDERPVLFLPFPRFQSPVHGALTSLAVCWRSIPFLTSTPLNPHPLFRSPPFRRGCTPPVSISISSLFIFKSMSLDLTFSFLMGTFPTAPQVLHAFPSTEGGVLLPRFPRIILFS